MKRLTSQAMTALLALLAAATGRADFNAARSAYQAGHYEAARTEFTALAQLGDCSSQFNLGAMALHGQGGAQDIGAGAGWLEAAAGNGCQSLVGGQLGPLRSRLTDEQRRAAAAIVAHYGREALLAQGIVDPDFDCRDEVPASALQAVEPEYPSREMRNGIVIGALTIGVDGLARDPQILLAEPGPAFAAAAVEAWLNTRFRPATRGGAPLESRIEARLLFRVEGAQPLWASGVYQGARAAAERGDPAAEYLVGLTATVDPSLGVAAGRGRELLIWAARDGYPQAQYWIGAQLAAASACHPAIHGSAWLQYAADAGEPAAQLALARGLLAGAAVSPEAARARALLERAAGSSDYYVMKHVAALLAASPVAAVHDPHTAQQLAIRLAGSAIQSDPQMFEVLAAVEAANGNFAAARGKEEVAIGKARALSWNVSAMQERLAAYRAGNTWQGTLLLARSE